jgi:hypothetical protein
MQIIFDEKLVPTLRQRYVVLELDTVMQPEMTEPITLYALIENIGLDLLPKLIGLMQQHEIMVRHYKKSEWEEAIVHATALKGSWNGEVDEFYDMLIETCKEYQNSNSVWDGVKHTTPIEE